MARTSRKNAAAAIPAALEQVCNTALYVRLSVEDARKKESDSIGSQKALLERYMTERPYLKLTAVYEDVNQSGTTFERPGFLAMMEAVKAGKISCIVVKDLSRFGRSYIEAGNYLENILPFFHVRFISVTDGYDSQNPDADDGLVVPLKNLMHDVYARDISQKVRSGLAAKREKGEFSGCVAAYGYRKAGGGRLAVDEEAAPVVRDMFRRARDGMGCARIAQTLNEAGIPSPGRYRYDKGILKAGRFAGVRYWHKSAVRRILTNPVYLGHMVQGKTRSGLRGGGSSADVPREQWVVVRNTHEPLVSEDIFLAVQNMRTKRRPSPKATLPPPENPLKGLVFCGDCGRSMKRRKKPEANGPVPYSFICAACEGAAKEERTLIGMDEAELLGVLEATVRILLGLVAGLDGPPKEPPSARHPSGPGLESVEAAKALARLTGLKSALYADFQAKLLDEPAYRHTKSSYDEAAKALRERLDSLDGPSPQKRAADGMLTAETIAGLIGRVEIFSGGAVSIRFRCRDAFACLRCTIPEE